MFKEIMNESEHSFNLPITVKPVHINRINRQINPNISIAKIAPELLSNIDKIPNKAFIDIIYPNWQERLHHIESCTTNWVARNHVYVSIENDNNLERAMVIGVNAIGDSSARYYIFPC
jgi:hypothetical protein